MRIVVYHPHRLSSHGNSVLEELAENPNTAVTATRPDAPAGDLPAYMQDATSVVVIGGDGTLRAVAQVLTGTGIPVGIVPMGTANITARALGLSVPGRTGRGVADVAEIAAHGRVRPVDVGWVRLDGGEPHAFLAVAGVGVDGSMVEGAQGSTKERLGWLSYYWAARNALRMSMTATLTVDGATRQPLQAQSILALSSTKLHLGLSLSASRPDDGMLSLTVLQAPSIVGWAHLAWDVFGGAAKRGTSPRIATRECSTATIELEQPAPAQLDGEMLGLTRKLELSIQPGALAVRTAVSRA